jgi:hypothetical protein
MGHNELAKTNINPYSKDVSNAVHSPKQVARSKELGIAVVSLKPYTY